MRKSLVVRRNRQGLPYGLFALAALFFGMAVAARAQVPSVTFTQTNGVSGVGFTNGVADFSGTGQHLAANSRGDLFIPVSDNNTQYIEEFPATGASPVILFTGLNPTYGGRAVYVDSASNLYYTYSDQVNYSVDVIYIPFRNGAYPASVSYTSINNTAGQCSAFPVPVTQTTTCRVPLNAPSQYNYYVQSADLGMDGSGNLYMLAKYESTCGSGPCYNSIIKFGTNGVTSIIAQLANNSGQPEIAVSKTGEIYYTDASGNTDYFAAGSTTAVSLSNTFYYVAGISIDQGGNVYITQKNGATGSAIIELPYVNGTACQGTTCGNDQYVLSYSLQGYTTDPNLGVAITGYGVVYYLGDYPNSVNRLNIGGLSFGATTVGTTSGSQTLLVTFGNNSSYKTFGHFTVTGPFNVTATTCVNGTTYGPYATQSCTVTLTYSASKPGPQAGSVEAIDSSGNFIGAAQLSGIGTGSLINVDPGTVSAVGGTWTAPSAIAVDSAGNTYVADSTTGSIYKTAAGATTSTAIATGFSAPSAVAVDGSGNVYVGDSGNGRIVEIALVGTAYSTTKQVLITGLSGVSGLAADSLGDLYVADSGNARVLLLAPSGNQAEGTIVTTVGSGYSRPVAVAIDSSKNLYISDAGTGKVYRYAIPTSTLTTVATGLSTAAGVAVDPSGSLFVVDSGAKTIVHIPNIGGTLTPSKQVTLGTVVTSPNAIAADSTGDVYVTGSNTTAAVAEMNRTSGLLQFGNEEETYSTPSSTATVSNDGTASVTFNNPYYTPAGSTAAYAIQSSTTCTNSEALAVGTACSIAAVFTPPSTGLYNDTLSFSSTPATTSTLLLSGTGVNLPHTTTTITSVTPSSPSYGQSVTVVATVAPVTAGAQPQGTVTFYVDNVAQTPASAVSAANGTATIVLTGLTATSHTIVANYSGSTTYAPSASAPYTLVVSKTATTTVVTLGNVYSNPTSQAPGVNVAIIGTVTPAVVGSLGPSSSVTFYTTGSSTALGSAPVVAVTTGSGSSAVTTYVATFNTTTLAIGTYKIYGVYSGDTNYNSSTSAPPLPLIISNPTILIVPASNTIIGGGAADILTVYSVAGFGVINNTNGQVDISCGTLPQYAACSISPPFLQVNPTTPGTVSLSVLVNQPPVISVPSGGGLGVLPTLHGHPWMQALLAALFLFPAVLAGFGLRRRKTSRLFAAGRMAMIALLLLCSATVFTGCSHLNGTYVTPKGTSTLLVSGTITTGAVNPTPADTISLQLIVQ